MSTIHFTRNRPCKQRLHASKPGFLCIELLQGLLILGVLLVLVSAFYVLSVHWQHQAIKRFEALDLISSDLTGFAQSTQSKGVQALRVTSRTQTVAVPELAAITGKPVTVEQKIVSATWQDERGNTQNIRVVS